jgi:hypothetical protein
MAVFEPLGEHTVWTAGATFKLNLRAAGIDFGVHTINVIEFGSERILTHENDRHVAAWNHEITLEDTGDSYTRYTDIVEIHAGVKTLFIWLWANRFYRHRQKRWRELL